MGGGSWDDREYNSRVSDRKKKGISDFAYDDTMRSSRAEDQKANPQMDPKSVIRESRDSAAHPESLAIKVAIDVTGSMQNNPKIFQKALPRLMGLLLKNGIEHPQIMFSAIGDATCDRVPFQVGQFESGVQMDDDLGRMFLEGGGGGQNTESYELELYFAARKTSIDCFEKRGKKGYLFIPGDEMPYNSVKAGEVKRILGDKIQNNIPVEEIVAEASKMYHIFFVIPENAANARDLSVTQRWISLLGQGRVVRISKSESLPEFIAIMVAVGEGKLSVSDAKKRIKEAGGDPSVVDAIEVVQSTELNIKDNDSGPKTKDKGDKKNKPGRI